ncbi:OmpP1/FadL family transporter [Candidatus Entotheonella palauensis]|uniref:OmpP1/FadL family transporter n=1 Tax=Candidatus Entotheonella palauensis TaxID=93172 RepID=UPI000B7DC5F5|nr:hypothetical protein [Candidatus Entotheonella palauensis]
MCLARLILWLVVLGCGLSSMAVAQTQMPLRFFELPTSLPNPVGAGARAAGLGFAFIGVADDATAASYNPGGLVQLVQPEISATGAYFLRVEDPENASAIEEQKLDTLSLNFFSVVFPEFFIKKRKVVTSLQIQRSFELKDHLDFFDASSNLAFRFRRDGRLFNISPAIAMGVTRNFSIGVSLNIWPDVFSNGWETETTFFQGADRQISSKSEFDFEGFNVTAGFLWRISELPKLTLGGVVRTPFEATVTHRNTISRPNMEDVSFTETLDMKMPLSYGLGFSALLTDRFTVSLDVSWVEWSDFRLETPASSFFFSIPTDVGSLDIVGLPDFREASRSDTTSVRLGVEYVVLLPNFLQWLRRDDLLIPLRAGLFYDPEASFEGADDFWGFSLGSGIVIWEFLFDIAYTFRTGRRTKLVMRTRDDVEEKRATVYEHNFLVSMIFRF